MTNLLSALALAAIIAGEAPGCPIEAKVAVAWVYDNRIDAGIAGGWFGDATPTALDLWTAMNYTSQPDPTDGSLYMIHPADRWREDGSNRMPWLVERTAAWTCEATELEAWK